ncbi:Protein phosphatase 2C family protein [Rhynchospora pubera]|uniref:protein-serine/threonine phosphatase n=1 Tax=Rhynchospora pubera TaxID=906938 RepID=A0AAV8CTR2_9POAL|nr:Protein phosphatase 2C family protein [Rhynchospora pubera]
MKDAVNVVPAFTRTACDHEYDFVAVYDGHSNSQVALACWERMHLIMAEEVARRWLPITESECLCWEDVMVESFRRLDAEVTASKELKQLIVKYDGFEPGYAGTVASTVLVAVVGENRVIVANCGVSPPVLSRGGSTFLISSEMQRIEEARGTAIESDSRYVPGLATSKSVDCEICKPEVTVTVMERVDEDEFLIIASDGLWDVISNETACRIVRECFLTGSTPTEAASLLTTFAISRNSRNNISVIVVQLSTQIRS